MLPAQYSRDGTSWYVSDGRLHPETPCSASLLLYNPASVDNAVRVTLYSTDNPPALVDMRVGAGKIETLDLVGTAVGVGEYYWIAVESELPVLPQLRHVDCQPWNDVPDALTAVRPYPGPLTWETDWIFPDCYQGGGIPSWYERETLTILNPNRRPVDVVVRWYPRGYPHELERRVSLPGERLIALDAWVDPPAISDRTRPQTGDATFRHNGEFTVRVSASAPVIAQSTRRARRTGLPWIVGSRSTIGHPVDPQESRLWYYPGGAVLDTPVLPRGKGYDLTWNLLFTEPIHAARECGSPTSQVISLHDRGGIAFTSEAMRLPKQEEAAFSAVWLHGEPWIGDCVPVNRPWSLTLQSDAPVAPGVCLAEFEMWSDMAPGAMAAINLYPGPLDVERIWWLGIHLAGGCDDRPAEWNYCVHIFNPGDTATIADVQFFGVDPPPSRTVWLAAGASDWVWIETGEGVTPFACRVAATRPVCAQWTARCRTRGTSVTRAMDGSIGLPMSLDQEE